MRRAILLMTAPLLCVGLIGCASDTASDSDPPPGVRKNENRNTGVSGTKKGKPFMVGDGKKKP